MVLGVILKVTKVNLAILKRKNYTITFKSKHYKKIFYPNNLNIAFKMLASI